MINNLRVEHLLTNLNQLSKIKSTLRKTKTNGMSRKEENYFNAPYTCSLLLLKAVEQ